MRQFSRWASMVGGLLEWLGVEGFLGNLDAFVESDPKAEAMGYLVARLGESMPVGGFTTDRAIDAIGAHPDWDDGLPAAIGELIERCNGKLTQDSRRDVKVKLQYWLRDANKWNGGLRVVREGKVHGEAARWRSSARNILTILTEPRYW